MIKEAINYEYSHWDAAENNRYTLTDTLVDVLSDHEYVAPAIQMTKYLSKADIKVYFYVFAHKSKNDIYPKWTGKCYFIDHTLSLLSYCPAVCARNIFILLRA